MLRDFLTTVIPNYVFISINSRKGEACPGQKIACIADLNDTKNKLAQ
jgi:hypothetical protein